MDELKSNFNIDLLISPIKTYSLSMRIFLPRAKEIQGKPISNAEVYLIQLFIEYVRKNDYLRH
jgi:hypothetical protein